MTEGENGGAVQAWRAGGFSMPHLALGFSVLVCAAMSILTLTF